MNYVTLHFVDTICKENVSF